MILQNDLIDTYDMNREDTIKVLNNDRDQSHGHVQVVVRSAVTNDVLQITVVARWIDHKIAQLSPSPLTLTQPALFFPCFTFSLLFQCHGIEARNHKFYSYKDTLNSKFQLFFLSLKSHFIMLHNYTTTPKLREWVEEKRSGNWRSNEAVNKDVMTGIWNMCSFFATVTIGRGQNVVSAVTVFSCDFSSPTLMVSAYTVL